MRFAFGGHNLFGGSTSSEAIELVKVGEELGYEIAWFSDNIRDPYAVMGAAARVTSKISLGVGVTDPFKRHPLITARSIATVNELAQGRAILGIGSGDYPEALQYLGIAEEDWRKTAYKRVKEMIIMIRRLMEGGIATSGEFYKLPDVRLLVGSPRTLPIYVAGSGPRILEVAGNIADGVIVWPADTKLLSSVKDCIRRGAEARNDQSRLDLTTRIHVIITKDREKYLKILKPSAALKVALTSKALFKNYSDYDELLSFIKKSYPANSSGGPHTNLTVESSYAKSIAEKVPDDIVDLFGIVGDTQYCMSRLEDLAREGVTQVSVIPIPTSNISEKRENLELIANKLIPAFTS